MTLCCICGAPPHEGWRSREDLGRQPICSGAESFLAGTASCRIEVSDVDALFAELHSAGVLHDVSRAGVTATDFGTTECATLDDDGNLLTFFRWPTARSCGLTPLGRRSPATSAITQDEPAAQAARTLATRAEHQRRAGCRLR